MSQLLISVCSILIIFDIFLNSRDLINNRYVPYMFGKKGDSHKNIPFFLALILSFNFQKSVNLPYKFIQIELLIYIIELITLGLLSYKKTPNKTIIIHVGIMVSLTTSLLIMLPI